MFALYITHQNLYESVRNTLFFLKINKKYLPSEQLYSIIKSLESKRCKQKNNIYMYFFNLKTDFCNPEPNKSKAKKKKREFFLNKKMKLENWVDTQ